MVVSAQILTYLMQARLKIAARSAGWLIITVLAIAGLCGCWQSLYTLWPGLHQDGAIYSTVAINRANSMGNTYDVYAFNLLHSSGDRNFRWHGQLYYPLAALFMAEPAYQSFLRLLHASNLLAFLLAIAAFFMASRRLLHLGAMASVAFGVGAGYAVVGLMQYLHGRPEHAVPLVLLVFLLIREMAGARSLANWVYGIQIGVVAAISPLPGALLAVYSVFALALKEQELKPILLGLLGRGFFAVATWLLLMAAVYPWSLLDWLKNTSMVQKDIWAFQDRFYPDFPAFNVGWVTSFWFTMPFAPGLGALFLLAAATAVFLLVKTCLNSGQLLRKLLLAACLIVPLPQIWWSGIGGCPLNYSLICFFPAVAVWLLEQMRGVVAFRNVRLAGPAELRIPDWISRSFVPLVLLFAVSWPGLGFARTSLMQDAILKNGVSYAEALARFEELKSQLGQEEVILIDLYTNPRSAVVFDGPPWKSIAYEGSLDGPLEKIEEKLNFRGKYIFYLQAGNEKSPERAGFKLIETNFNFKPVEIFGKTIRSTTPGYGYAIYERIEPHASDYNSVQQVIKE